MGKNKKTKRVSVLFVCLGNICRSPTAEGVFRQIVASELGETNIFIDSAGTAGYHVGQEPDRRAIQAAKRRGYSIENLRARKLSQSDFSRFDYVIAMDRHNLSDINILAPPDYAGTISLFLKYAANYQNRDIPDPYYGVAQGFGKVLDMIEDASRGLVEVIRESNLKV